MIKECIVILFFLLLGNSVVAQNDTIISVKPPNPVVDSLEFVESFYKEEQDKYFQAYYIIGAFPRISYSYNNGNYGSIGIKVPFFIKEKKNSSSLMIGVRANMAYLNNHFIIIPEGDVFYATHISTEKSTFGIGVGSNFSPYYIGPKVMLNYNLFPTVEMGYNFEFNKPKHTHTDGFFIKVGIDIF